MNVLTTVCGVNPLNLDAPRCPVCKEPGNRIKPETLRSMLKDGFLTTPLEDYSLCLSKDCDVAYFGKQVFYKDDIRVKIWFKEQVFLRRRVSEIQVKNAGVTEFEAPNLYHT